MNIQTVIANLLNTIEGKEEALALYESRRDIPRAPADQMAIVATIEFLKLNLQELNTILNDCMAVREADIVKDLERKDNFVNKNFGVERG